MTRETNAYAELCHQDRGEQDSVWTETSGEKIRAYLGLNIAMGASPRHQYEDYWKDDDFSGLCSIQICDVAEQLCETYLVFKSQLCGLQATPLSNHPIKRVKPLYDISRANFKEYYTHSTEISNDEAMKGFKRRTELRQYMPAKPEKFGIKF
uniref:PiggyBac transposable element-derived protein 4-like n=1 Tax=Crassostrea virginica TaxID=6565 RepID=A0A8B8BXQ2_CRAVI|nr:piggyBac transposable element-derived protein 4-like [Crassostrea virginica]